MYRQDLLAASVVAAAMGLLPLQVCAAGDHGKHQPPTQATTPSADMTEGEVRKVDKESAKLTLKHADIKSLDMPAMTMVFVVKDKAMLDKLQVGDKVKFKAINDAGKFTVTEIQVIR